MLIAFREGGPYRGYSYKRSHLVALAANQNHGVRSALDVVAGER